MRIEASIAPVAAPRELHFGVRGTVFV